MAQVNDWWVWQFMDALMKLVTAYEKFEITREIEDFDIADLLCEKLNAAYEMSLDLLDYVEIGRAYIAGRPSPIPCEGV